MWLEENPLGCERPKKTKNGGFVVHILKVRKDGTIKSKSDVK